MIGNKKFLIFGGSGSLGNAIIKRYLPNNNIVNYSRDESKHWKMELEYKSKNLKFIIGDIRDKDRVETTIIREDPNIIIIASALKHVDRCEFAVHESLSTNLQGTINVTDAIERNEQLLTNLENVVFISTDKACEPTNVYGMCKSLSETVIIEKSLYVPNIKFINVRYGNVLNSRGSIIPLLHEIGKDDSKKYFTLTHKDMTRFVMTLEQSVDLIEYGIIHAESGDTVIPKLISMNVKDMIDIFSEKYKKPIRITKLRPGEKMLESLISETQAYRLVKDSNNYYFIKPPYKNIISTEPILNYNSRLNPLSKSELYSYLLEQSLL